jgi:hypothetical protein
MSSEWRRCAPNAVATLQKECEALIASAPRRTFDQAVEGVRNRGRQA